MTHVMKLGAGLLVCVLIAACTPVTQTPSISEPYDAYSTGAAEDAAAMDSQELTMQDLNNMTAVIETSLGTITFQLYADAAPNLSRNFAELASRGYYDGTIFHRVIKNFMIQGGDPEGTGMGGTSYLGQGLADEAGALKLKHTRGAVSWAKSSLPNSIGSQFFIVHQDAPHLDGGYSVFGRVIEGMDVVDKIANSQTDAYDRPIEEVKMVRVHLKKK